MTNNPGGPSPVFPCGPPDPCQKFLQEILEFIQNLQKRYWDLRNNVGQLPMDPPAQPHPRYGTRSIRGERHQFRGRQQGLRNRLDEYNENGCGDPPPDAWKWASIEVPEADAKPNEDANGAAKTVAVAAGATILGGLGGYAIYKGIRMIPSLAIPPLWWTIPANAALP